MQTDDVIKNFFVKYGKTQKGGAILEAYAHVRGFREALNHKVAIELMQDWSDRWQELLMKIVSDTATEREKVEFQVLDEKLTVSGKKIEAFFKMDGQIGDAANGEHG